MLEVKSDTLFPKVHPLSMEFFAFPLTQNTYPSTPQIDYIQRTQWKGPIVAVRLHTGSTCLKACTSIKDLNILIVP